MGDTIPGPVRATSTGPGWTSRAATPGIVFGRVPHPPCEWRVLGPERKPRGWDRLGPRRVVGTCVHRMEGSLAGTERHFLSDHPHGRDALTDYGVGGALDGPLDGAIWTWTSLDDDRSPWANGPADDLDGDGPAFVRAYGHVAIHRDLRSIELSGRAETPVTPRQIESLAALVAYWHDRAGMPWSDFPVDPRTGVVTQLQHWEFSGKACPFGAVREITDRYQARAREIMRAHQTGTPPDDLPLPPPPGAGLDEPWSWLFGSCTRTLRDGSIERWPNGEPRVYRYDPRGVVSRAWRARAAEERRYPRMEEWRQTDTGDFIRFANGWVLAGARPGTPGGWRWLDG